MVYHFQYECGTSLMTIISCNNENKSGKLEKSQYLKIIMVVKTQKELDKIDCFEYTTSFHYISNILLFSSLNYQQEED